MSVLTLLKVVISWRAGVLGRPNLGWGIQNRWLKRWRDLMEELAHRLVLPIQRALDLDIPEFGPPVAVFLSNRKLLDLG